MSWAADEPSGTELLGIKVQGSEQRSPHRPKYLSVFSPGVFIYWCPAILAVFRKLQRSTSYFVTVPERAVPSSTSLTVTICRPSPLECVHTNKKRPRSRIHTSLKLTVDKLIVRRLSLEAGSIIWIRILPFTENVPEVERLFISYQPRIIAKGRHTIALPTKQIEILELFEKGGRTVEIVTPTTRQRLPLPRNASRLNLRDLGIDQRENILLIIY